MTTTADFKSNNGNSENNGNKKGHNDPQPGHGNDTNRGHKPDKPQGKPTKPSTSHCSRV